MRAFTVLLAMGLLVGCGSWSWRVPTLQYPPREVPAVVYPGIVGAAIAPESYAVASAEISGQNMDVVMARLADDGRRRGADAVVMMDFDTMTAWWASYHRTDTDDPGEIARTETIETTKTWTTVDATGLRSPRWCLGLDLSCGDLEDTGGAPCVTRIDRIVLGGAAEAAELRVGNQITAIAGTDVAHPWDVHQWVDELAPKPIVLTVAGPTSSREVTLTPLACEELYAAP